MKPRLVLVALVLLFAQPAGAQDKAQTVRPEVGKPLQAALDQLKAKHAREALARAKEAQAVPNKTPYESYLVTRVIGQAAAAAGEGAVAAQALESAAASPAAPEAERVQLTAAAAAQYYALKEYAKSASLATRYFKLGGTDKSIRTIYVQSLYLDNQFAAAAREIASDVDAEETAGRKPSEEQLQLLANAYLQAKDNTLYGRAMEKLVAYYPKRDYWLNVLQTVTTRPGFNERLVIDVGRLKLETGTLRSAQEYVDLAQMTLIEGFPAEAVKIIDKGFAAGVLGTGPEANRHRRLKALAAKNLAEDRKNLEQSATAGGGTKDGKTLFNDGYNWVLNGKADKGLAMMQEGLRTPGSFTRPDHAMLQMGYAYHVAGQNDKAVQAFKRVQGSDGAGALARLWVIRLGRPS